MTNTPIIETDLTARLDRLPWGRFHTLIVAALGITWMLDGLEVTLAGSVAGALKDSPVLQFSNIDVGLAGSAYIAGAVLGALLFGWLTDRMGRRKLFFITLLVYAAATIATAFSWNLWSFMLFRFLTGAGIGGEYAAINSAIQEFMPPRVRGWTDLVINGSFWLGAALGALGAVVLLDPALLPAGLAAHLPAGVASDAGWRLCFFIGGTLALGIFFMRMWVPESPRWLVTHGREAEARRIVEQIESSVLKGRDPPPLDGPGLRLQPRSHTPLREVLFTLLHTHRRRSLVSLALMTSQAFFYNAIFFTYALVLTDFYGIASQNIGWYILPFALGNFLGPLLLGRLFDVIGRRIMIAFTYAASGALLALSGWLFSQGLLDATTQTLWWMLVFFFASAAASSAYLTVSETFPLEMRALAIAVFYAIGTGLGGVAGPVLFGWLIESGQRGEVFAGYLFGAALMIIAAGIALKWGVDAERKSLETVAPPLSLSRH